MVRVARKDILDVCINCVYPYFSNSLLDIDALDTNQDLPATLQRPLDNADDFSELTRAVAYPSIPRSVAIYPLSYSTVELKFSKPKFTGAFDVDYYYVTSVTQSLAKLEDGVTLARPPSRVVTMLPVTLDGAPGAMSADGLNMKVVLVENMRHNSRISISVAAHNALGSGFGSRFFDTQTEDATPSAPTILLRGQLSTTGTLGMRLGASTTPAGENVGLYQVRWTSVDSDYSASFVNGSVFVGEGWGEPLPAPFEGILGRSFYDLDVRHSICTGPFGLTVQGVSEYDTSMPSNTLSLTMPPGPPSPPLALEFVKTFFVGNGQTTAIDLVQGMAIYFQRPACTNHDLGILVYVARYHLYGDDQESVEVTFAPQTVDAKDPTNTQMYALISPSTAAPLKPNRVYELSIAAESALGRSAWSVVRTHSTVPLYSERPGLDDARFRATDTSLTIAWNPPKPTQLAYSYVSTLGYTYRIYLSTDDGQTFELKETTAATSYTVTGLPVGQSTKKYFLRVQASNGHDWSPSASTCMLTNPSKVSCNIIPNPQLCVASLPNPVPDDIVAAQDMQRRNGQGLSAMTLNSSFTTLGSTADYIDNDSCAARGDRFVPQLTMVSYSVPASILLQMKITDLAYAGSARQLYTSQYLLLANGGNAALNTSKFVLTPLNSELIPCSSSNDECQVRPRHYHRRHFTQAQHTARTSLFSLLPSLTAVL
jgi:hypothetical protein